jgi:hypothetical protein
MRASFDSEVFGKLGELGRPPNPTLSGGGELQGAGLLGSVIERVGEALAA